MLPKEDFVSLERVGNWLRKHQYSNHAIFELLQKGTLKAIILHPLGPLHPFAIPTAEWLGMELSDFKIQTTNQIGRRRSVAMYINDEFSYNLIISKFHDFAILANVSDESLLTAPDIALFLDPEVLKNESPKWSSIHRSLLDHLIDFQNKRHTKLKLGKYKSRVFVRKLDCEEFIASQEMENEIARISQPPSAGRGRLPRKDKIWTEILSRYYSVKKKDAQPKRAEQLLIYAESIHLAIGVDSIRDMLRAIDELASD